MGKYALSIALSFDVPETQVNHCVRMAELLQKRGNNKRTWEIISKSFKGAGWKFTANKAQYIEHLANVKVTSTQEMDSVWGTKQSRSAQ